MCVSEFYQRKRVVVTGAAGFIGSHLVDALVAAGAEVSAVDNLHSGVASNLSNSANYIHFYHVDVRERDSLLEVIDSADVVFHLAGNALVPYSHTNPAYDFESNVLGTYYVLEALAQRRIGRVLFSSSAAVYGIPRYIPVDESHVLEPVSPYGASKLAAERLGAGYARAYGLHFVIARIYNTYGPRQRKYVMYDLLNKLHRDPYHLEVMGDGNQMRDYCYASDTVRALLILAERGQAGEAYNVAGGNPIQIAGLVPILTQVMGLNGVSVVYTGQSWEGDIPVMVADIQKVTALGFVPQISLREGLAMLVNWMRREIWLNKADVPGC